MMTIDASCKPVGAPACTATGMCLNFVVGARKDFAAVFDSDKVRWANDYRGFEGYVDWFTLGIDGKRVTFNFEPARDASFGLTHLDRANVTPDLVGEDLDRHAN